jgi:hypothetical protein
MGGMAWCFSFGKVSYVVAAVQDAAEYLGVQRLYAAPEYFGKAGEVFHGGNFGAFIFKEFLGATGGVERYAVLPQNLHQRSQPVFVIHGQATQHEWDGTT